MTIKAAILSTAQTLKAEGKLTEAINDVKREMAQGDQTLMVCGCGVQDIKPLVLEIFEEAQ